MAKKNSILFSIFLTVVLFLIFSLLVDITISNPDIKDASHKTVVLESDSLKIEYPEFNDSKLNKLISEIIKNMSAEHGSITYKFKNVDNKYLNILFEIPNNRYQSYIINIKNYKLENINVIFKNKNDDILKEKISEMLKLKYPSFIYNVILNGEGEIAYLINENELIVYFSNYAITPAISEPIIININYHEIFDYLDINYFLDETYINKNIYTLDPTKKTIAFTFDDGPKRSTTTELLQILNDNHANATFFMLGNRMNSNKELIKNIIASENDIGNHSYSHKYLTRIDDVRLKLEISMTEDILFDISGQNTKYFRVPYGSLNEKVRSTITTPIIRWSVDTNDWKYKNSEIVKENILSEVHDGDIVLMHDIHSTTVEAVRMVLPELYANGYQVTSVSKLSSLKQVALEAGNVYNKIK